MNVSSSAGHLSKIPGAELRSQLAADDLTEESLNQLMTQFVQQATEGTHSAVGWPIRPAPAYTVSKVGVSALTRIQQRYFDTNRPADDILVNCCHPGYVKTDMTGHTGWLTADQGAVAPTYLALLPPEETSTRLRGGYVWCDKQIVDWVNGPTPADRKSVV